MEEALDLSFDRLLMMMMMMMIYIYIYILNFHNSQLIYSTTKIIQIEVKIQVKDQT